MDVVEADNLYDAIPEKIDYEIFSDIFHGENIRIERIISEGHTSPDSGWYDQSENEWVVVLEGEARLSFQNKSDVHLVAGSHINIPAYTRHKVVWTAPNTKTVWLAVYYQ